MNRSIFQPTSRLAPYLASHPASHLAGHLSILLLLLTFTSPAKATALTHSTHTLEAALFSGDTPSNLLRILENETIQSKQTLQEQL